MISPTIKIEGLEELKRVLKNIPDKAKGAVIHELRVITNDLKGKAQKLAPVLSGDLKGSAFAEVTEDGGTVGFTEPYALRQHEEVTFRHPKGGQAKYLEQPYKENSGKYATGIGEAIERAVKK